VHAVDRAAALGDADGGAGDDDGGGDAAAAAAEDVDDRLAQDPALRRRAYRQALYRRRAVRASLGADEEELGLYAAAAAREHAGDVELTDVEDIVRPGDYKRGSGDDPLERACFLLLVWRARLARAGLAATSPPLPSALCAPRRRRPAL
jgi:hypothetical protein